MKTPVTLFLLLLVVCATAQDTRNCVHEQTGLIKAEHEGGYTELADVR